MDIKHELAEQQRQVSFIKTTTTHKITSQTQMMEQLQLQLASIEDKMTQQQAMKKSYEEKSILFTRLKEDLSAQKEKLTLYTHLSTVIQQLEEEQHNYANEIARLSGEKNTLQRDIDYYTQEQIKSPQEYIQKLGALKEQLKTVNHAIENMILAEKALPLRKKLINKILIALKLIKDPIKSPELTEMLATLNKNIMETSTNLAKSSTLARLQKEKVPIESQEQTLRDKKKASADKKSQLEKIQREDDCSLAIDTTKKILNIPPIKSHACTVK